MYRFLSLNENTPTSVNWKGLLLSPPMLIPHYVLMFFVVSIKILTGERYSFSKIPLVILTGLSSFILAPIIFCLDFWFLATVYSNMSFGEATKGVFLEMSLLPFLTGDETN